MKRTVAAMAIIACALLALTQELQQPGPKQQLVTMAAVEPLTLRPGTSGKVEFLFRVNPGLHINSNQPHSKLLVATRLELSLPAGVRVTRLVYPKGEDIQFPFATEKMSVYTNDFSVTGNLLAAHAKPGTYPVTGELQYQACDNRQCYPPRELPVEFQVTVK